VNDTGDVIVFLEDGESVIEIAEVYLVILYFLTHDLFDAFHDTW
jgi:hypothetical protein